MKFKEKALLIPIIFSLALSPVVAYGESNSAGKKPAELQKLEEENRTTEKEALEETNLEEELDLLFSPHFSTDTEKDEEIQKLKKERDQISKELLELKKQLNVAPKDKQDQEKKEVMKKRIKVLEERISDINARIIFLSGNTDKLKKLLKPTKNNHTNGKIMETVNAYGERFVPNKRQAEPFTQQAEKNPENFSEGYDESDDITDVDLSQANGGKGSGSSSSEGTVIQSPTPENKEVTRQFLSFQTKSGKELHLIIDYEKGKNNVRLLTEVSEEDLLNMAIDTIPTDALNRVKTEQELETTKLEEEKDRLSQEVEELTKELQKEKKPEKKSSNAFFYFLIVLMAIGILLYNHFKKKRQENRENDSDYDENFADIDQNLTENPPEENKENEFISIEDDEE